jgi:hypothetical protein
MDNDGAGTGLMDSFGVMSLLAASLKVKDGLKRPKKISERAFTMSLLPFRLEQLIPSLRPRAYRDFLYFRACAVRFYAFFKIF